MDAPNSKSNSSYGKPPWLFKGSSLYQLHLVKADRVRSIIPKELKLVEAFGYTLGGFFLASYDDSPAAAFDELVVIAGIVWNPPTSCAWASKVLVSSDEACVHGRKAVGLPSQVAKFSKKITSRKQSNKPYSTWGFEDSLSYMDVEVSETTGRSVSHLCNIAIPTSHSEEKSNWASPEIKMNLPSFSGRTQYNENLLKYSCQIRCRLSVVKPAIVSRTSASNEGENGISEAQSLSVSVMLSKPILALKFNSLRMMVEAPVILSYKEDTSSSSGSLCAS